MAIALIKTRVDGVTIYKAKLLDDIGAINIGEWISLEGIKDYTITVDGITNATVTINVSNKATRPANADHEAVLDTEAGTGVQGVEYTAGFRWLKARVSAWVSGDITVEFVGRTKS